MCEDWRSWCRNDASVAVRRSLCCGGMARSLTSRAMRMRPLFAVLGVQLIIGIVFVALVVSGTLPFTSDGNDSDPGVGVAKVNHFDGPAAWKLLQAQLAIGPRPAGSAPSRKLAAKLKKMVPHGRYQAVPGGLRNVVGRV